MINPDIEKQRLVQTHAVSGSSSASASCVEGSKKKCEFPGTDVQGWKEFPVFSFASLIYL